MGARSLPDGSANLLLTLQNAGDEGLARAAIAVVLTDTEGRIQWCSLSLTMQLGWSAAALRGQIPWQVFGYDAPADPELRRLHAAIVDRQRYDGRVQAKARDGSRHWVDVALDPRTSEDGQAEGFVLSQTVCLADQSLGFMQAVLDNAAAGIIVRDRHGIMIVCNREAERLLGKQRDHLIGRHIADLKIRFRREDGSTVALQHLPTARALRWGVNVLNEIVGVVGEGAAVRWLQVSSRMVERPGAEACVVTSFTDVTAQRDAIAALASQSRRLDAALDGARAGAWEWNIGSGEVRLNMRSAQIAGYALEDLEPLLIDDWMRLIHPGDIGEVRAQQARHLAGETDYLDVDCRLRHKDGSWVWIAVRGCITTRDDRGRPAWMYGTHINIDDHKRAELDLQRTHAKLEALFKLSPVGIALNDVDDARFLKFNEALRSMTGYTETELSALRHRDICPADRLPEVQEQRALLLAEGRYGPYESELLHKEGHRIPVQLAGVRITLPDGVQRIWSIVQDIGPRKALEARLLTEARTDRLTGLPNRSALMERLQQAVERTWGSADDRFALLFLDFDRFKLVNDTLGHEAGDRLLQLIAERLREAVRERDAIPFNNETSLVARFGGDEFVVLLHGIRSPDQAAKVANRLLKAFSAPYTIRHTEIHSSASIGIALLDGRCESAADVLRDADMAMYEAKRAGRGSMAFFEPAMLTRLTRAVRIEEALRNAIRLGQLTVVYQPIIDLETGQLASAEALVRWGHPELGPISPAEFIPIAEDSGQIAAIGDWVLEQACAQWREWHDRAGGFAPMVVSVNLSRTQLANGEHLIQGVQQCLAANGMLAENLQLEITEREVMRDPAETGSMMHRLRDLGVKLAMDDFGTGTSSLACLRDLPFDVIKIDKSFVDGLAGSAEIQAVMHATISLVQNLGMSSVAEGIEQSAQIGALQAVGCRYGQGYLFSKPVPGERMLEAVRRAASEDNDRLTLWAGE